MCLCSQLARPLPLRGVRWLGHAYWWGRERGRREAVARLTDPDQGGIVNDYAHFATARHP